jgi:hypothetical protein
VIGEIMGAWLTLEGKEVVTQFFYLYITSQYK